MPENSESAHFDNKKRSPFIDNGTFIDNLHAPIDKFFESHSDSFNDEIEENKQKGNVLLTPLRFNGGKKGTIHKDKIKYKSNKSFDLRTFINKLDDGGRSDGDLQGRITKEDVKAAISVFSLYASGYTFITTSSNIIKLLSLLSMANNTDNITHSCNLKISSNGKIIITTYKTALDVVTFAIDAKQKSPLLILDAASGDMDVNDLKSSLHEK